MSQDATLVDRLRSLEGNAAEIWDLRLDAADHIEQLERELDEARKLLLESKRGHYYCEDPWYSCPQEEDGCADDRRGPECDCGADQWNKKIDAFLDAARSQKEG